MNDLRRAMDESEVGAAAVSAALVVQPPKDDERQRLEDEARAKAELEAQRQGDFDAALADVVELVSRHRTRLGRKTCSQHDGATIRKIFDLVRGLMPGPDNDL